MCVKAQALSCILIQVFIQTRRFSPWASLLKVKQNGCVLAYSCRTSFQSFFFFFFLNQSPIVFFFSGPICQHYSTFVIEILSNPGKRCLLLFFSLFLFLLAKYWRNYYCVCVAPCKDELPFVSSGLRVLLARAVSQRTSDPRRLLLQFIPRAAAAY